MKKFIVEISPKDGVNEKPGGEYEIAESLERTLVRAVEDDVLMNVDITVKPHPENKLPEFCFAHNPSYHQVTTVKRGEKGYWLFRQMETDDEARKSAKELNERMNVDKYQAEAMLNGSMFGWEVPGADPDFLRGLEEKHKEGQPA